MGYEKPLWQDNAGTGVPSSYAANLDRMLIAAAFPYSGVLTSSDFAVSQRGAGADSSVDVTIGRAIIYQASSTDKAYSVNMTGATVNVPLPASPGSNSRYDMIYLQVRDSTISGSVDDFLLVAVSGTAAASPVEPAAPSGQSLLLARVTRTAGTPNVVNSAIQDRRVVLRLPPSQATSADNNVSGITATTPNNGTTTCGVAFRAPASGTVLVGSMVHYEQTTGGLTNAGPQVREGSTVGSGTVVFNPADDPGTKLGTNSQQVLAGDASAVVTGLTPGNMYNVCATVWASSGGTIMYFARRVWAIPQP
jgi:hypothetical protein